MANVINAHNSILSSALLNIRDVCGPMYIVIVMRVKLFVYFIIRIIYLNKLLERRKLVMARAVAISIISNFANVLI